MTIIHTSVCSCPHCSARRYKQQRYELLEAIEAHRSEKSHGPTANMEHADNHLYTLADRIRREGEK